MLCSGASTYVFMLCVGVVMDGQTRMLCSSAASEQASRMWAFSVVVPHLMGDRAVTSCHCSSGYSDNHALWNSFV